MCMATPLMMAAARSSCGGPNDITVLCVAAARRRIDVDMVREVVEATSTGACLRRTSLMYAAMCALDGVATARLGGGEATVVAQDCDGKTTVIAADDGQSINQSKRCRSVDPNCPFWRCPVA